ncbi:UNVERIFIED_CONTAM: hypothetical protein GTU68_062472 [Idotea baltica]|nr:hypothetical protein [Idotea baltica]
MSRVCELVLEIPQTGNTISHAKIEPKRRFLPNLNDVDIDQAIRGSRSFKFRNL